MQCKHCLDDTGVSFACFLARATKNNHRKVISTLEERESEMHAAAAALNTLKSPGELLKNALENIAERACAYVYTRARAS